MTTPTDDSEMTTKLKKARWMVINQTLIDSNQYITTLMCPNCGHLEVSNSPEIREAELPQCCDGCGADMRGER